MQAAKEKLMGRFSVETELMNDEDRILARRGQRTSKVRRVRIRGVIDSGATWLVIPKKTAEELGLEVSGTIKVRYANGKTAIRSVARNVRVRLEGRESVFDAVIEPNRDSALVGAVVLEILDLLVDCGKQRLVPRDPKQIISEVE